ncbi:MAG: glycosyltransferase family 39 protein [Flavobacteriales bacterium]
MGLLNDKKTIFYILFSFAIIRFLVCILMGVQPQDVYYFYYAENLDLSYFDHPPMIAYFLKISTTIFGKSAAVLKLTDFVFSTGTLYFFYKLSKYFLSERRAIFSTLIFGSSLLLSLLSIISTPDVPLIFFWTLSLLQILSALNNDKWFDWILVGLLMGLTFDSKYTGLILGASLVLFLLLSNTHRRKLFSYRPILALLFFLIAISPVIIWNYQNDFISLKFQSSGRANAISTLSLMKPTNIIGFLGSQAALITFIAFGLMVKVYWKIIKRIKHKVINTKDNQLFLFCFSFPLFIIFTVLSPIYWVKINWIMPVYVTGIIMASYFISIKGVKWSLYISLFLHLFGLVQVIWVPIPIKSDDTWVGWEELSIQMKPVTEKYPNHFFWADDHYKTSSALNFYLEKPYFYGGNVIDHFALQYSIENPDLSHLDGENSIMIDSESRNFIEGKEYKMIDDLFCFFEEVIELEPIYIRDRSGEIIKKFVIRECKGFHHDMVPENIRKYTVSKP